MVREILSLFERKKRKKEQYKKSAAALDEFINYIYWGEDISPEDSVRNIEHGIIEITCNNHHSSNGILITDDGYFITANHCLGDHVENPYIILDDGNSYPVEKLCARSKKVDVALAKANVPGSSAPMRYKLFNKPRVEKIATAMIKRKDGKLVRNHGYIDSEHNQCHSCLGIDYKPVNAKHHFILEYTEAVPGDSGGVVIGTNGELLGLLSAVIRNGALPITYVLGVKMTVALEIISLYSCSLKKRSGK